LISRSPPLTVIPLALLLAVRLGCGTAVGQDLSRAPVRDEVFVNSEIENYLRLLQVGGLTAPYPWSLRSFSPREIDRLAPMSAAHPWAQRYDLQRSSHLPFQLDYVRPRLEAIYNSAFPHGANLGSLWAGRGLTTAVHFGGSARYGPVSLTLAPVAFRSANEEFELLSNGQSGPRRFRDGWRPNVIDRPQRFGDEPYSRIDPGQSTLRVDVPGVTVGVSTANQHWGPATDHPILLGANAPGFLHAFLGTSEPLNVAIGRIHARAIWGQLEQSSYSPMTAHGSRRLMSGVVGIFTPRGVPGLELGAARFFHEAWPREGLRLRHLGKPFEQLLKANLANIDDGDFGDDPDNQLASIFVRWMLPRAGFEVYGEYGRNDHNWDLRDFFLEPDQNSGHLLGFRKVWSVSENLLAVRGEVLNTAQGHVKQVREQVPFYIHSRQRQGHTHRGQVLGSAAGYGGGGSVLAADYYHRAGRLTVAWRRELRQERGQYWWDRNVREPGLDVLYDFGVDALIFYRRWDIGGGVNAVRNLNRNFASDEFNLHAQLRVTASF
jgi:hypothetical protein